MTTTIPAGWLPIESAPKDGQSILGRGPRQDTVVIAWHEWAQPEARWKAVHLDVNGYECPEIVLRGEPTHWMPLPAAPGVSTVEDAQAEQPYCYALETRGRHGDQQDVLLDVEYNGTDSFSGGRTGGIPLYRRPVPAAGDALERQYTSAMGEAAQAYMDSFPFAHKLPAQFRWADLWTAMYGASHASDTARDADVSILLAFIFERFGQPGDAGELPDSVAAAVRRLERAAIAAQRKGDA